MRRFAPIALAAVGPMCVGLLRLLLPYYTAADSTATARAVAAHPGRESAVLWLGLVATVTLVPGLVEVRNRFAPGRLRTWSFGLTTVGYLVLPVVLVADAVLWVGQHRGLQPAVTARLLDGLHPTYALGLGVFILAHVVGTTLIGVLTLRRRALPVPAAWALTISQPLHFVATVILGSPEVDFVAWSLTAVTMGMLADRVVSDRTVTGRQRAVGSSA
jgi:hypothetical protein